MQNNAEIHYVVAMSFEMWDFEIKPILCGAQHRFTFEKCDVTVSLPQRPIERQIQKLGQPLQVTRSRIKPKMPLTFAVNEVYVTLDPRDKRRIPVGAIGTVNVTHFTNRQRTALDKITWRLEEIGQRAFEYWLSMLRWKSANYRIRPTYGRRESFGLRTYLRDKSSGTNFYRPTLTFTAAREYPLMRKDWKDAECALGNRQDVPIWRDYLADAHTRHMCDDPRRAIVSLAVASETLLRRIAHQFLAHPSNEEFQKMVGQISISRFIESWTKLGLNASRWLKQCEPEKIKKVFDKRNAIMHRGVAEDISNSSIDELIQAVAFFLSQGEKHIDHSVKSVSHPL
jgi:hypothetical protein